MRVLSGTTGNLNPFAQGEFDQMLPLTTSSKIFARILFATAVFAPLSTAGLIQYMVIPATPTNPFTTTLPNYGSVTVTDSSTSVPFTFQNETPAENQSAGAYSWGTDTNDLNLYNTTGSTANYTVTFTFNSGAPDPSKLLLIVAGLAANTTATVSQPGSLAGEFHFTSDNSSTTLLSGQVLSSKDDGDALNTGWALYQATGSFTTLSVTFSQQNGDGLGVTLAYAAPAPEPASAALIGASFLVFMGARFRRRLRLS